MEETPETSANVMTAKAHRGEMRVSMDMLKHVFLLPDGFTVEYAYFNDMTSELRLVISSIALPETSEHQELPLVIPTYQKVAINTKQYATILAGFRIEPAATP